MPQARKAKTDVMRESNGKTIPVVEHFLEKPEKKIPIASAETGYHLVKPDEVRKETICQ
jgi:hypothetical protein